MLETKPRGLVPSLQARLFGAPDPAERLLRRIARKSSRGARLANATALALIICVSMLSLVGLGGDSLMRLTSGWTQSYTGKATDLINVLVGLVLVVALDTTMLHAAAYVRKLRGRRAQTSEILGHIIFIATCAVADAGTYTYASWELDHPSHWLAWCLIMTRAILIPVTAIYLSLARTLPVAPRDILAEAELVSGSGMIRNVVAAANNESMSLADHMALFGAVAVMVPEDQVRLEQMIKALLQRSVVQSDGLARVHELPVPTAGAELNPGDSSVPREAGWVEQAEEESESDFSSSPAVGGKRNGSCLNVRTQQTLSGARRRADSARADSGRSQHETVELRQRRVAVVAETLATTPKIGVRQMAQLISERTGVACPISVAQELLRTARVGEAARVSP